MTCSKCGRDVPVGESWCACGGPAEFSARDRGRLRVDVRARVLWGDPVETIREEWLKKGAPGEEIRVALHDAVQERHRHFRTRGLIDVLSGIGCFIGAAIAVYLNRATYAGEVALPTKVFAIIFVAMAALPVLGLWFSWRGVRRLAMGGTGEKGASDLSD